MVNAVQNMLYLSLRASLVIMMICHAMSRLRLGNGRVRRDGSTEGPPPRGQSKPCNVKALTLEHVQAYREELLTKLSR